MKLLSTFENLSTITSSGAASGYPAANLADPDPGLSWKADAYTGDLWLKMDFGAAKVLNAVFLNQANFPACTIQGNATDTWTSPSFTLSASLAKDEADNRKGWFALTAFNYQFLRILIPASQTLDAGTVPQLGNLIVGQASAMPRVSDLTTDLAGGADLFQADGGNVVPSFRRVQSHVITISFNDALSGARSMPKTWEHAVIFEDLDTVAGAWLVIRPQGWNRNTKSLIEATGRVQFQERV